MRKLALLSSALLLATGVAFAAGAGKAVSDSEIGLSKTSVNDVPVPDVFAYREADPTSSGVLPRAYDGAPPQVPHSIADFVPIKPDSNMCQACHMQPDNIGKKTKGEPTPLPISHYEPDKAGVMDAARYNCTQCHTPQAEVKPLVNNTFTGAATAAAKKAK